MNPLQANGKRDGKHHRRYHTGQQSGRIGRSGLDVEPARRLVFLPPCLAWARMKGVKRANSDLSCLQTPSAIAANFAPFAKSAAQMAASGPYV